MDLSEIKALLEEQGATWQEFRQKQFDPLRKAVQDLEKRAQRLQLGAADLEQADLGEFGVALRSFMKGDDRELKGMSVGSDPAGGYMVLPAFSQSMTRVEVDYSPIRQIARVVPIEQADAFEEVLDKDVADASWVGETAARTATSAPQVGKLRIPVHEIYAMPEATQTMIDDAKFDVGNWLAEKVGQKFGVAEGAAFVSGSGLGQPRGFLSYSTAATADASRSWGAFEHVATGSSGAFGTDPNGANVLINLVHKLKAGYRRGAVWVMNKGTAGEVRKLKDGAGRFVWVDSLLPGTPPSLLGYPVVEAEDMPDISAGSLSIAFGNFQRGYTIVDRIGLRMLVDPFTNKPYVRLYTYKRVGGDVNDFFAIKFLKFS
jgi:HK97 family phage major capsid protein